MILSYINEKFLNNHTNDLEFDFLFFKIFYIFSSSQLFLSFILLIIFQTFIFQLYFDLLFSLILLLKMENIDAFMILRIDLSNLIHFHFV
jgi:hypothetical protein